MTDLELIQLLQQKSAGELTPAEVDAIRARWTQSPELRQALVEHLHLESQLVGALAPVKLDVDMILKRASQQQRAERPSSPGWGWLIGLSLLLASGIGLFVSLAPPNNPPQVVETDVPQFEPSVEFPADALLPSNMQEPSADSALDVAIGEKPPAPAELKTPATVPEPNPNPKPIVVEVAANEPWSAALARDLAPWASNSPKLTSDYKSSGHDEFSEAEAKRWFAPVEGLPFGWSTDTISNPPRRMSKFQGLAKLRAPWPNDAVLRLTPFEVTDLTLYFWRGPTGVALRFYTRREPHLWAAFEIVRENSSPKPTRLGLLTTDSGAYSRSTPGMLDIRQQDGELVLARGGLVLLSVPFPSAPLEVYVEGEFRLRGLSMFRSAPFAFRPDNEHPVLASGSASKVPWAVSVESPASLIEEPDGSVSMTVDSREKTGLICFPFGWLQAIRQSSNASGLFEVIVNVESADPGTGIFLGDRDGRPLHQLAFFKDSTTQQTTFGILRPGEVRTDANYHPNDFPPPYLAKSAWFKLTAGLGTLHVQSSGDGRHWGHIVESPGRDLPGAVESMGLFGLSGPGPRTIRVRQIQVRQLNGITDLADPKLSRKLPSFRKEDRNELKSWNHRVLESQPDGSDTDAWFTTSAVATLSQGPPKDFGVTLLRQLLKAVLRSSRSFEQKQRFLDDACTLCDTFDDGAAQVWGFAYEELGRQRADSGEPESLAKTRAAWLWSPIWTSSKIRSVWERLHSRELLQAAYRRDWPTTWRLAQSAGFWNLLPHPDQRPTERGEELDRHARWAKTLIGEVAPQLDNGTAGVMPVGWRHPFVPALNKEAYNVRAELESALSGQNYEDACRIVMSIAEHDAPGLLPDPDDRQLYVSMPTAIANGRRSHPGFAQTMSDKFEPLGQIRVQSAMNRRDFAALQTATLQFMGTDAARNAHVTLGDLALSIGQFEVAEQHFHDALVDASLRSRETIEPRLLLTRALSGRLTASQTAAIASPNFTPPIVLNGTSISATEFQAIIGELVSRSGDGSVLVETSSRPIAPFPRSQYKLEPRAQFDGHPGTNPGRGEFRSGDPFGKQLAVASDETRIYVSNRFQVNAYSVNDGRQLWAQGLGSEQGDAYALRFTPMKPLLAGHRLFVRRLTKAGTELACLMADDGQVVWHVRPSLSVVSDPVIWNGRLFAVTLTKIDEEFVQVEATWFDSTTGSISTSRPLYRFRDAPDRQFSGQFTVSDRIAVFTMAGTTASFDLRGEMRWLRRSTLLQKPVDELAEDSRSAPPVIQSGRVITTMPGVREVTCLNLDSGSVVWAKPIFDLRGLIDFNDGRVVIDTVTGLMALDAETGETEWQLPIDTKLEGLNSDGKTLTVTRRSTWPNKNSKPVLMWIDLKTGQELAQTLISVDERDETQLGPMFSAGGKWWSFVGQTWKEPKRDLHEFIAIPAASPKPFIDETLQAWRPKLLDMHLAEIQSVVPGWFPVADYHDRLALVPGDVRGETFSLISRIDPWNGVHFTCRAHLAGNGKTTLILRVGNQPGQKWKLTVRTTSRILLEQVVEDAGSTNGWWDVAVDLSPVADQDVTLYLMQTAINNAAEALWKKAELITK